MPTINVSLDGHACDCRERISVAELLREAVRNHADPALPILAALVNNDLVSLSYPLTVACTVIPLTLDSPHGWRVYRRSLSFLLAKAVNDCFPEAEVVVQHSFGTGLYCLFATAPGHPPGIDTAALTAIAARMRELVDRDIPITRRKVAYTDAVAAFTDAGFEDKAGLLRHRNPPRVVLHECDGFRDLAHGPLAPSTGVLGTFDLLPYEEGFILQLPERSGPRRLAPFVDQPHLFQIFREHKRWGQVLGVDTVSRLNALADRRAVQEFVFTAEALHERKLAAIAETVHDQGPRVLLIAGPSSAGKTTFAQRLAIHLRVHGIRPVTLGTDNYFVGDADNPRHPDGRLDYEHIEAVDLEAFNRDLATLAAGRAIRRRTFDFKQRAPVLTDTPLALADDQILIIEGIHGLNPRLTEAVPEAGKFRIFVSALTQLSVDRNNRIATTDNRLLRRLVRDFAFRGHSALETLRLWPGVRQGEKRWIFPFQQAADATFNSALDYELAVLKPMAEPLLARIKPDVPEYAESRRLTEFLLNFVPIPAALVPPASILREYIGGSALTYD